MVGELQNTKSSSHFGIGDLVIFWLSPKSHYLEYKGYKGSVEYSKSKENNCLFGKVQGMSKNLPACVAGLTTGSC